jgi:hypothetical protein
VAISRLFFSLDSGLFAKPAILNSAVLEAIVRRIFGDQYLALAGVVGLADDAFVLHALHNGGGTIVADL